MPRLVGLTMSEIQSLIREDDIGDVSVSIIPPEPDPLTDEEEFDDDDLLQTNVHDVAGTLEFHIEDTQSDEDFSPPSDKDSDESQDEASNDEYTPAPSTSSQGKNKNKRKRKPKKAPPKKRVKTPAPKKNKPAPKRKKTESGNSIWRKKEPTYTQTTAKSKDDLSEIQRLYGKSAADVFSEFVTDEVLELIRDESIFYSRQKNNQNFLVTTDELRVFLAILLFSGYHTLPQENMYWEASPDAGVPFVYNAMTRNRFKEIKRYLHLNDNTEIDASDKMFKLRPYFDAMNKNFMKFAVFSAHLSLDEMMVKYYGRHSAKMYMKGKPIKFGYKIWCLTSSTGYLYQFQPYLGKDSANENQPLGGRVITKLISVIPEDDIENHELFFDNFFTSVDTMAMLKDRKLKATGTIREGRTNKCPLREPADVVKNTERGFHDYRFDDKNEVLVVRWHDNKAVSIATNYDKVTPLTQVKRFSQREKRMVNISMPHVFVEYNASMGGVDMLDKLVALYRIRIRSKKWWFSLFTQFIDVAVVNTFRLVQLANPREKVSLLDVRRRIVLAWMNKRTTCPPRRPGPNRNHVKKGRVLPDVRFDNVGHTVITNLTQRRCAQCGKKTTRMCEKCDVGVHDKCFKLFHSQ